MRLAIVLTAVSVLCSACGGSSDSGQAASQQISANQNTPPSSTQPVHDPMKDSCSDNPNCEATCNLRYPTMTDSERSSLCHGQPASASCSSYMAQNDANAIGNAYCLSNQTSLVMTASQFDEPICQSLSACIGYCDSKYPFTTDQALEGAASANGTLGSSAFEKQLIANHVAIIQHAACLLAPYEISLNP